MSQDRRGQLIVVKDVNGELLVRRLWDVAERGVYVLSEEEWLKRTNGLESLDPVGFPMGDAFSYAGTGTAITDIDTIAGQIDNDSLTPFFHTLST